MLEGESDPKRRIANAVLAHLRRYPATSDTAAGVRDWWLPADLRALPVEEVEAALADLMAEGRLQCFQSSQGGARFAAASSAAHPGGDDPA